MLATDSTVKRSSTLSQVLNSQDLGFRVTSSGIRFPGVSQEPGYRIKVATQTPVRERAYRLAYRLYLEKEYVVPDSREMVVSAFDANPDTLTLLASRGSLDLGTISLNLDGVHGLPCDEVYSEEINVFRNRGARLAEVTRLAVSNTDIQSRQLLIRLFYSIYIFAYRLHGVSHLLIEVNPKHVDFYQRLMTFEPIGQEKSCIRVKGAPANLLVLDLARVTRDHEQSLKQNPGIPVSSSRLFYNAFPTSTEGESILKYMAEFHRPMEPFQKQYFLGHRF